MPEQTPLPRALATLAFVTLTCLPSPSLAEGDVSPAIVRVVSTCNGTIERGTGFVVTLEEGLAHVVTAAHVVEGCEGVEVEFSGGRSRGAETLRMDDQIDLALLRVLDPPGAKSLLISTREMTAGSVATVVGFPRNSAIPIYSSVDVSGFDGGSLVSTGLVGSGSSGSPMLVGQVARGLVTTKEGAVLRALPGAVLKKAVEGWLGVELPVPEDAPGRRIEVIVSNHEREVVPGFRLRRGRAVTEPTDETGYTELELSQKDDAGMAVQLEMHEDLRKEWVLATWQVNVPHVEESEALRVVAIRRSDFRNFPSEAFDQPTGQADMTPEQQWQMLVSHAREKGLAEDELRQAIESFADTKNLIDQGIAEMMQGAYPEAEQHFEASLKRAKARIALRQDDAADAAMHLGLNRRLSNRFSESVLAYREALGFRPEDPGILSGLGIALIGAGGYSEAVEVLTRAYDLFCEQCGDEHSVALSSLNCLAVALGAQGDRKAAREILERTVEIQERLLGGEHPETLATAQNLAIALHDLGDLDGARRMHEKTLEIQKRLLGDQHPDTLFSMSSLATTLGALGDFNGARRLQEKTLEIKERVLGSEHPDTLISMNNLVVTLYTIRDFAGARRLCEKVLEVDERTLGGEHPNTLASMNNLAAVLRAFGDLAGARDLHERVFEIKTRTLGVEHPDTLTSMNNLASVRHALGDLAGAKQLHGRALEIRKSLLGVEHPDTLKSMNNLAHTLLELGEIEAAKGLLEKARDLLERVLGVEHHYATATAHTLLVIAVAEHDFATTAYWLEKLRWLAERDEAEIISPSQRQIRAYVLKVLEKLESQQATQ